MLAMLGDMKQDLSVIAFSSREEFAQWLEAEHDKVPGIWMKIAKKASGIPTIGFEEAIEVALCYGWIDGQRDKLDDDYYLQRFTPRRPKSNWSSINCRRIAKLSEAGEMRPAGLAQVESAKADGRWQAAYDGQKTAKVPEDLQEALAANPAAAAFFATLDSRNRYSIIYRIGDAKKPETRAARIVKYVTMLNENKKIY
jgi:uncharacterized protein YdeI (YjbR/CyaY-like superfamily)